MNAFAIRSLGVAAVRTVITACLAFIVGSSTVLAQWTVVDLHPAGATASKGNAIRSGVEAGEVDGSAALWTGNAASYVNLGGRAAYGTDGVEQVGTGSVGAGLWTGTPGSFVALTPPPPVLLIYVDSEANGVHAGLQVGTNVTFGPPGNFFGEAGIWTGSGASWTSLHPTGAGAVTSTGEGTHNGAQVGSATVPGGSGYQRHAALWFNTAASFVDLHPLGGADSIAYDVYNGVQVGAVTYGIGSPRASLWTGSAASVVDLHPAGAASSELFGVYNGLQAGYVTISSSRGGLDRASLWSGTAASWVNLHAFLPAGFTSSRAEGVWTSNTGLTYIVGWAVNANGFSEAKLWVQHQVPEPSSLVLLTIGVVAIGRRRMR